MKHIIEWAHAFTDEDSQAAWNMYQPEIWFSLRIMINAVDSTEQWRQNLIPQPPADTEKACSHGSHSQQHPGGRGDLNYVPGALSSCRLDKVVIVTRTVCVSLQRLHACLAVRLSMFVLWQMFWVYFAWEMSKVLTVFVSQRWWAWTVYCTHSQRACVPRTCKYCHLVMEYLTVTFL